MELLVVRHGLAEDHSDTGRDADRALTAEGRRRVARVARSLRRLGLRVDRVLHSPWRRAAETAALLAPLLPDGAEDGLVVCEHLAEPPGRALLAALRDERVAVVGHEPWMSELIALLVAGAPGAAHIEMRKASVAWLDGDPRPGHMVLRALLPPRVLAGRRA